MNKTLIGIVVIIIAGLGAYYGSKWVLTDRSAGEPTIENGGTVTVDGKEYAEVRAPEYGVQFEYRTSPEGFVLIERGPSAQDDETLEQIYTLMREDDYEELMASTEPREGPPSLYLYVFTNPENMQAGNWADAHPNYSNVALATSEMEDVVVAGANAVEYGTDGLYTADTIVVPHGGFVYVLIGQYANNVSPLRTDFDRFVDTLEFIPAE
jgi:hypothetical protein